MAKTMRAARMHVRGEPLTIDQLEIPTPAPHRRARRGEGVRDRAQPRQRAQQVRRVVPPPLPPAAAGDLRTRPRRGRRGQGRPGARHRDGPAGLCQPCPVLRWLPLLPHGPDHVVQGLRLQRVLRLQPGCAAHLRGLPVRRSRRVHDRAPVQPGDAPGQRLVRGRGALGIHGHRLPCPPPGRRHALGRRVDQRDQRHPRSGCHPLRPGARRPEDPGHGPGSRLLDG